jgi:hypothetical protein
VTAADRVIGWSAAVRWVVSPMSRRSFPTSTEVLPAPPAALPVAAGRQNRARARPACCRGRDLVFVPVGSDQGSRRYRAPSPALAVPGRAGKGRELCATARVVISEVSENRIGRPTTTSLVSWSPAHRRRLRVRVRRLPWPAASILGDPQVGSVSETTGPLPGTFLVPAAGLCGMLPRPPARHSTGGVCGSIRPAPKGRSPYRPAEAATRPPPRRRRLGARPNCP